MKKSGVSSVIMGKNNASAGFGTAEKSRPVILSALLWCVGMGLGLFRAYAFLPQLGVPDVLLIYVLALSCFYDGGAACLTALCAGALCDVLGSETVGLCTLFYTAAAFISALARDRKGRAIWYYCLTFACAAAEIVLCLIGKICGGTFSANVFWCAGRTALYGAVIGSFLLLFTAAGRKLK